MSAYALPGLFPPLPLDGKINYSYDSCYFNDVTTLIEEKVEYDSLTIVIEESKIDTLELVKALTTDKKQTRGRLRRRSIGSKCFKQFTEQQTTNKHQTSSPEEASMLFTLRVSLNGRTFNVERNLARIRSLYMELIEETEYYDNENGGGDSCIDPVLCSSTLKRHLPAFPNIQEGVSTTSFGILNAVLQQYTPSLQKWLNDVFKIVSPNDSPSLTYFLCEPLLQPKLVVVASREYLKRGTSAPGRLECIKEEEKGDEE